MSASTLRPGFTTGAAAAASTKAALILLCSMEKPERVPLRFLSGELWVIEIHAGQLISDSEAWCSVIKDGGDDPDVTHKAEIGARVVLSEAQGDPRITVTGGTGVGRVTKPGLDVAPGNPAINPGPLAMIREAVLEVLNQFGVSHDVLVEIFVPEGEVLAKKTLNARLGIVGGLSILGTTGMVRPMSHEAYIATIKSGISVAAALKIDTLVFTTGRRSERFAMELLPEFPEEAFIQIGDFFKASLEAAAKFQGIRNILITVFFGKALKMAMGFEHTHAAKSELTLTTLADWALSVTSDPGLSRDIADSNTARHAFEFIHPAYPELITHVGTKIRQSAKRFSGTRVRIRSLIFDFKGTPVFDSGDDY